MGIINFLIISTLMITTFIHFNKSIDNLDCTSRNFQKKLNLELSALVRKKKRFFLPTRCKGRLFILGKIKGRISNE